MEGNDSGGLDSASINTGNEDTSPSIKAGRKQAKRLLRLAQDGHLNIQALHDAQRVVAKLHGYPDWRAWTSSQGSMPPGFAGKLPTSTGVEGPTVNCKSNAWVEGTTDLKPVSTVLVEQVAIELPTHLDSLSGAIEKLGGKETSNVLSIHFGALREKLSGKDDVEFVDMNKILATNLLLSPLGSDEMLAFDSMRVVQILIEMMGNDKTPSLMAVMANAIEQAFQTRSLGEDPVMRSFVKKPLWITEEAFSVLKDKAGSAPIAYYEAEKELIGVGLMDDAWQCHIRAMPTIIDVAGVLIGGKMERKYKQLRNYEGASVLDEIKEKLTAAYSRGVGKSVFDLPQNGVVVFQIDPINNLWDLNAPVRWMYANMLGNLRNIHKTAYLNFASLPLNAYGNPHETRWVNSIFPEQRDKVLGYLKKHRAATGVDIFDEMDGPIESVAVENLLTIAARENRKWGRGMWICMRNIPSTLENLLVGNLLARGSLLSPRRLGDGVDGNYR